MQNQTHSETFTRTRIKRVTLNLRRVSPGLTGFAPQGLGLRLPRFRTRAVTFDHAIRPICFCARCSVWVFDLFADFQGGFGTRDRLSR